MSILKEEWSKDFLGRVELHKNGMKSIAGYGSSLWNVRMIIAELPNIFKRYGIKNMLDIPCGDFYWMKEVDLSSITYLGADLVDGQITFNKEKYPQIDFRVLNMVEDKLPTSDLVFTRDCLVHLNYENIGLFIDELIRNGSKYLMATHCPQVETNMELNGIIGWRPLNLEKAPFNFPKAIEIISEQSEYNPEKCMGIWSLEDIKKNIKK
jgi:hypothetical protein